MIATYSFTTPAQPTKAKERREMEAEGKKRLLKLATLLHDHSTGRQMRIPGDGTPRFDLDYWIRDRGECGTAACAVGCAMLSPWFQKQGLETRRVKGWTGKMHPAPAFGRRRQFPAVEAFFGISPDNALYLFHPLKYGGTPTPKQVAKRIRAFVKAA